MEAQEYLASCACPEYLRKAERRLAEEVERCVNYLDPSSEPKITAVVEQELIRKQASCLCRKPCARRKQRLCARWAPSLLLVRSPVRALQDMPLPCSAHSCLIGIHCHGPLK